MQAVDSKERRGSCRVTTDKPCEVTVLDRNSRLVRHHALLLDISLAGARIECDSGLGMGTELLLDIVNDHSDQVAAKVVRQIQQSPKSGMFGLSLVRSWPPDLFYSLAFPGQLLTDQEIREAAFSAPVGWKPIPGYRFVQEIGSGGSGAGVFEVIAPGGFAKAVKRVRLDPHNPFSLREIMGFRLIRSIRHPYLLSIDRLSVEENQLVVVMELGDGNLRHEFESMREQGAPGIPRQRLLMLMRETAEVLDLLNLTYLVQHLDIKPENLLLVGGHIKLADFGLVREIEDDVLDIRSNAVTPWYAAPELLDGRVSPTSDQYSLAIVYQEMLTGRRPFAALDVRQILLQHLREGPDLSPLPPEERPILARALDREPEKRFGSCGEMVDALILASSLNGNPLTA